MKALNNLFTVQLRFGAINSYYIWQINQGSMNLRKTSCMLNGDEARVSAGYPGFGGKPKHI